MLYLTVNCELSSMIRETPHERRRDPTIVEQTKTNKILAWINNDSYVLSLRTYTVVEPSLYTNTPPDRHGIANLSIRPRNTLLSAFYDDINDKTNRDDDYSAAFQLDVLNFSSWPLIELLTQLIHPLPLQVCSLE